MPFTIPPAFKTALQGTIRLANAIRIVRADGSVYAMTDADWDTTLPELVVGSVTVPETFYAAGICDFPTDHEMSEDISEPDNWELIAFAGIEEGAYIPLPDVRKMLFRGAEFIWIVFCPDNLDWQFIKTRGKMAEHDAVGPRITWKMKGLADALQQEAGEVTSPLSRAVWGDPELAFFDLDSDTADGFAARVTGEVSAVDGDYPRRSFTLPETIGFPAQRFNDGTVTWTGGVNAGTTHTVLEFDGTTGTFTLDSPTYHDIEVGDELQAQIRPPLTIEEWILYFGDATGFAGEPAIPTVESANSKV